MDDQSQLRNMVKHSSNSTIVYYGQTEFTVNHNLKWFNMIKHSKLNHNLTSSNQS